MKREKGHFRVSERASLGCPAGRSGAGRVMLFNGTNSDPTSKAIYQRWLAKHAGTDHISGSPTADMRAALVENFRDHAAIGSGKNIAFPESLRGRCGWLTCARLTMSARMVRNAERPGSVSALQKKTRVKLRVTAKAG